MCVQAQDEYERRLKEEVDAKMQKEREIEQLVRGAGMRHGYGMWHGIEGLVKGPADHGTMGELLSIYIGMDMLPIV